MKTYITIEGDCWDSIAKTVYGSEFHADYLMKNNIKDMWRTALEKLGSKYETWSRFPQVPTLN